MSSLAVQQENRMWYPLMLEHLNQVENVHCVRLPPAPHARVNAWELAAVKLNDLLTIVEASVVPVTGLDQYSLGPSAKTSRTLYVYSVAGSRPVS